MEDGTKREIQGMKRRKRRTKEEGPIKDQERWEADRRDLRKTGNNLLSFEEIGNNWQNW